MLDRVLNTPLHENIRKLKVEKKRKKERNGLRFETFWFTKQMTLETIS